MLHIKKNNYFILFYFYILFIIIMVHMLCAYSIDSTLFPSHHARCPAALCDFAV